MTDRVAIVTGGLRGLGRGMTLGLAASGVRVLAVGHLPEDVAAMEGTAGCGPWWPTCALRQPATRSWRRRWRRSGGSISW